MSYHKHNDSHHGKASTSIAACNSNEKARSNWPKGTEVPPTVASSSQSVPTGTVKAVGDKTCPGCA